MLPDLLPDLISLRCQTLCEVQLLHRYFLNVGDIEFDHNPPGASVLAARRDYDVRLFWQLVASPATAALLRRHRLLLQATAEGLRVVGPPPAPPASPPAPLSLTFWAYPTDSRWPLYTELPPEQGPIDRPDLLLPEGKPYDKVSLLTPDDRALYGRVLTLTAPATPPATLPADGLEPLSLALEPWAGIGAAPRPVAVLRLPLTEGAAPRHFVYVLGNRHTTWLYKSQERGPLPLVRHGRINPVNSFVDEEGRSKDLPNPTPATTEARPTGYYSLVY